jgi:hypothetical protein
MHIVKEVLRLTAAGLSQRQIGRSLHLSHGVVGKYQAAAQRVGLSWPLPEELDDAALADRLGTRTDESSVTRALLTAPSQDIVRLNFLPRRQASITPRGIHFEGDLYYECELAQREEWFVKARNRGQSKTEVAYDPRTTERIYLPLDGGTKLEVCTRTAASTNLPALDCYDAMDYYALERAAYQASETPRLTSSAALQSRKEAIVGEAMEKRAQHWQPRPYKQKGPA